MKKFALTTFIVIAGAVSAFAVGFDGMALETNNWFAADFTADLAAGSAIVANSSTGVTYGAGSWTTVPATGTAVIAVDEDAGGGATMLSLDAPGEELTFAPSPYASPSGMETFASELKADALDADLPALGSDVQGAFTVFDDGEGAVSAMGWTASGWTNLVGVAASGLTNAWFTLYTDFATVEGVRFVRYSAKPASGSCTVLTDGSGTAWFRSPTNAVSVTSVSLSGVVDCRHLSGDELEEAVETVYKKVWSHDFEDSSTYMDQISGDTLASSIFGTSANMRSLPYAYAQDSRTIYNTETTSRYFVSYQTGNNADNIVLRMASSMRRAFRPCLPGLARPGLRGTVRGAGR